MEPRDVQTPEPENPQKARGVIILGTEDPMRFDKTRFNDNALLFHASKRSDFHVDEKFDYDLDQQAEGMTLGRGLYATSSRQRAEEYVTRRASESQGGVFSLIPYQARMLDLRQVGDPSKNAAVPNEIVSRWVAFARPKIEAQIQEWQGDLTKLTPLRALQRLFVRFEHLTERSNVDLREDILGTWNRESKIATSGSKIGYIWDSFCKAQGIDGVIYNEGGEMNFADKFDTTYVFNNLSKIGTYTDWQRRARTTQSSATNNEQSLLTLRDQLKRLSLTKDPEALLMEDISLKPYINSNEFWALLERAGVETKNHKRGTFMPSKDGKVYVYVKRNFICPDLESAQEKLRFCEEMTKNGALFPGTKWGIFQRPSGQFHVFAVTRKLELAPASMDNPLRNSAILHSRLGPDYDHAIDDGEANRNPMGHSPGSSVLYPVDIEVISLSFDERKTLEREREYESQFTKNDEIVNL